jgi:outer membrane protein TolC
MTTSPNRAAAPASPRCRTHACARGLLGVAAIAAIAAGVPTAHPAAAQPQPRAASPATPLAAPAAPPEEPAAPLGPLDLPPLPEAPIRRVTLAQALAAASRAAADARLAELGVRRALAAERAALAALLPQINGVGSISLFDREVERAGQVLRPRYQYGFDLQVQETFSVRAWNGTRIAAAGTRAARLRAEEAQRQARGAVARVYYALLAARRNAELARQQLAAALRQDQVVAARLEAGAGVPLDRARTEIAVLDARQRVAQADAQLAQQQDLLGQALGLDEPVDAAEEDARLPVPGLPGVRGAGPASQGVSAGGPLDRYVANATRARADLRAADAQIAAARLQVDDAWFRFLPALQIAWTGLYRGPTTLFNPTDTQWTAVASLVVPLYDGGARYGALDDARAQVAEAEERAAQLRRSAHAQVRDAYRRAETALRSLELAERSVALAAQNRERAEVAYAAGAATGVELDDARRQHDQAETTRLLRALDRQLALVDLLTAAGLL